MFYVVPEPIIIVAVQAHYTSDGNLKGVMIEFKGSDRVYTHGMHNIMILTLKWCLGIIYECYSPCRMYLTYQEALMVLFRITP